MTGTAAWARTPERGSGAAVRLMARIALGLGWPVANALLHPVTLFFLATAPAPQRRAMRRYLSRALGREAGWRDLWRLWFCFAACMLDRVFLLTGRTASYRLEIEGTAMLREAAARGQGLVLLGAHMGSFDALRAIGGAGAPVEVRMLMHPGGGAADALFDSLDPARAGAVIPLGRPDSMLEAREVIARGGIVGLLADRATRTDRMVPVPFLGAPAPLPAGPMTLAAILHAPVVLGFALRTGPRRYTLRFEPFAPALDLPRGAREEAVARWLALYAERLGEVCRAHPYNWFNFHDIWAEEA